jgi:hypothetical protein
VLRPRAPGVTPGPNGAQVPATVNGTHPGEGCSSSEKTDVRRHGKPLAKATSVQQPVPERGVACHASVDDVEALDWSPDVVDEEDRTDQVKPDSMKCQDAVCTSLFREAHMSLRFCVPDLSRVS